MKEKKFQKIFAVCFLFLVSCFLVSGPAFARPERMVTPAKAEKLERAKVQAILGSINLSNIEDPETRSALQAIVSTLDSRKQDSVKSSVMDPRA